jgi:thiol-disulfide isomerase/thioredoxin
MRFHRLLSGSLPILLILILHSPLRAASLSKVPTAGDPLAEILLPLPEASKQRAYLGIPASTAARDRFALHDLSADLVVVEIFSMYCPHCQREAPKVNLLFEALQKRPKDAPRIRLLGIGVGNSPMEVAVFRKTYSIAFPLFPDGDFIIHKQLGEVRTPFFLAFRPGDPPPIKLVLAHLGPFESVHEFTNRLNELAQELGP